MDSGSSSPLLLIWRCKHALRRQSRGVERISHAVGWLSYDSETRTIADYRCAYNAATNQSTVASSFYDHCTGILHFLKLLEHALNEVAVPHPIFFEFDRFRNTIAADTTIFRLQQLLSEFPATHHDATGVMLYLVHNAADQSVISDGITDETTYNNNPLRN